ncbi:hypothetical protein D1AOALGA4SA_3029 [Olavius algarvensis Delta 1 endosymbiont]|nr:hypothetical protein D1AOALGA4SA_3029 [Olavius algarvensis Delta 1 endosymbiont]
MPLNSRQRPRIRLPTSYEKIILQFSLLKHNLNVSPKKTKLIIFRRVVELGY